MMNTITAGQVKQPKIPENKIEELPEHEVELDVQTATGIEKVTRTVHAVDSDHAQTIGIQLANDYKRNFRNINAVYGITTTKVNTDEK